MSGVGEVLKKLAKDEGTGSRGGGVPEKPVEAIVVTDALERLRLPPKYLTMDKLCGCLPVFIVCCGLLASVVLFFSGWFLTDVYFSGGLDSACHNEYAHALGHYFIGLAFFVGPLLFGIAGMLHRMNQKK